MGILGGHTAVTGRIGRAKSNALTVALQADDGGDIASARQKGSAGVLFGFKNGGSGTYRLASSDDEIDIAVGATTTVSRDRTPVGRIVPADGGARFEDADGSLLAMWNPYQGTKADDAWRHPLTDSAGADLGAIAFTRTRHGWKTFDDFLTWTVTWDMAGIGAKLPSAGSLLSLNAPVSPVLGDLLAAACVDVAVFPKGYIKARPAAHDNGEPT